MLLCAAAIIAIAGCSRQEKEEEPMPVRIAERMGYDWLHRLDGALSAYSEGASHGANSEPHSAKRRRNRPGAPTQGAAEKPATTAGKKTAELKADGETGGGGNNSTAAAPENTRTGKQKQSAVSNSGQSAPTDKQTQLPSNTDTGRETDTDQKEAFMLTPRYRELRECFVDEGWERHGFDNPTVAIHWFTNEPMVIGDVKSIGVADGNNRASRVTFEVQRAKKPVTLEAHIVLDDERPKCCYLREVQAVAEAQSAPDEAAVASGKDYSRNAVKNPGGNSDNERATR